MVRVTFSLVLVLLVAGAVVAAPALGQQVEIKSTPLEKKAPPTAPLPHQYQTTRPTDADYYAVTPKVNYDPAFVFEPIETETGQVGVAGWTSPNTPVGAFQHWREVNGWFGLGLTFTWGAPPAHVPAKPVVPTIR